VAAFLEHFTVLLHYHGHRGPNEVEPAAETWGTSPEVALAAIDKLRAAGSDADPHAAAERLARERVDACAAIRRRMPPGTRWLADRLVASAARGAARREMAKGTIIHHVAGLRQVLFAVADRMVTRGQLPDRFSLFMVTVDELPAFLDDPESFAERVEDRRRRYHELNALTPPSAFSGRMPDPSTWTTKAALASRVAVGDELTGIGVSSGRARGRVRIVTDPADPLGLSPDEILVAPLTDPAWTPLFLAASAVVVDVGAVLSHAAIVARELGIPAVVSVEGASAILRDGDEVEVDGDRGVVRVAALVPL
jgi:pyruvate,water dikinase